MSTSTIRQTGLGDTDDVLGRARTHALDDKRPTIFHRLIATNGNPAPTITRVTLGLVMLPHALQKTVGVFGGNGLAGTCGFFTSDLGVPGPLALLAIVAELLGAVSLILGVWTRAGALAITTMMVGAIALVHLPHGFFMNWQGSHAGEGFEYHLLAIGLATIGVIYGGGRLSVDRALMNRHPTREGGMKPDFANVTEP